MPKRKPFWKYGQRRELANRAGISEQNLSEILHRRRGVSVPRAVELEAASRLVLDEPISWEDWLKNMKTNHPAFSGKKPR